MKDLAVLRTIAEGARDVEIERDSLLDRVRVLEEAKINSPRIVCLCGSTRFKEAFDEANYHETMAGKIVLSVGFFMHASGNRHGEDIGATPEQKIDLDELHKRKIDLADEVLILNVNGYIGESTRSELNYAVEEGKHVRFLEEPSRRSGKESP